MAPRKQQGGGGTTEGVELEAPDGSGTTTVSTPTALNNLVYGAGYKPVGQTIEEALAKVQGIEPDRSVAAQPGPIEVPTEQKE